MLHDTNGYNLWGRLLLKIHVINYKNILTKINFYDILQNKLNILKNITKVLGIKYIKSRKALKFAI